MTAAARLFAVTASKAKKQNLHNWQFTVIYNTTVVTGYTDDGHKITQPIIWFSEWTIGTPAGIFRLQKERGNEWGWAKNYTEQEKRMINPKNKKD